MNVLEFFCPDWRKLSKCLKCICALLSQIYPYFLFLAKILTKRCSRAGVTRISIEVQMNFWQFFYLDWGKWPNFYRMCLRVTFAIVPVQKSLFAQILTNQTSRAAVTRIPIELEMNFLEFFYPDWENSPKLSVLVTFVILPVLKSFLAQIRDKQFSRAAVRRISVEL